MFLSIPDVTLTQVFQRIGAALITFGVYGWTVATTARALGDRGPAQDGRTSLNPLTHLDPLGVLALIFYRVGWVRAVAIDLGETKRPRLAAAAILLASVFAMVALGVIAVLLRPVVVSQLGLTAALNVNALLTTTAEAAIATGVVGLLPFPPLLGYLTWGLVKPGREHAARRRWVVFAGYGVMMLLMLSGVLGTVVEALGQGFMRVLGF